MDCPRLLLSPRWTVPTFSREQDNWRGILFDLEEDTEYEVRVVVRREDAPETEDVVATAQFRTWASEVLVAETVYLDENTKFPIMITGFGVNVKPDVCTYGGSALARPKGRKGEPIRDPVTTGILVYKGMRNTVIERCWIHNPINRSTAWCYRHSFGPVGAVFAMPDHSTVFRYNDVIGSDLTPPGDWLWYNVRHERID